ncbi:MAG: M6 family metalloprotease domain-containing protein [Myxococcales bacterium]|nr:M6 family metalloprotease domain-containing protein [Myxococcales bacterium]
MKSTMMLPLVLLLLFVSGAAAAPLSDGEHLAGKRRQMIEDLANLQFDRLGNPVLRWDHIPKVAAPKSDPHQLLVVLVEFQDVQFDRFNGDPDQGSKLAAFYQETLFDPNYGRVGTLSHYFHNQSLGVYHLQGKVLTPFRLAKTRAAYGLPQRPAGGSWRNDSDTESLVEEVFLGVFAQHPDLDWRSFDRWDPTDFDGDGDLAESDGYLDHFVLVYAGGGQSSCQRLYKIDDILNPNVGEEALATLSKPARECAERIWPHRFLVQKRTAEGPMVEGFLHARGGVPIEPGLWGRDYNMQSEYTDTSTFIHEFGHSIGLPDIYARTSYNSTGGWELMSGTASPLPQSLSAWSRMMLGWLRPHIVTPPDAHGKPVQSTYLSILDTPSAGPDDEAAQQKAGLNRNASDLRKFFRHFRQLR